MEVAGQPLGVETKRAGPGYRSFRVKDLVEEVRLARGVPVKRAIDGGTNCNGSATTVRNLLQ